ncbi:hypothetical protein G5C51_40465 [Streptomyces sp. A7024]|uniref:Polysaccharide lyase n=1 Tax=Streptomyces coryli TaxID=1128680 RepID=A0A6G4UES5_9ACTN|nr:heparin lyase I family protein [Streptomyces coryli]NGN70148.1 hypothetical protein [Streptomyces coryli]
MPGRRLRVPVLAATAATAAWLLTTTQAHAALLWTGDPAKGLAVFGNVECPSPGSLVTADQPDGATAYRYEKAVGSERCETRGIRVDGSQHKFAAGQTYWLGWESKVSTTTGLDGDFSVFQWKSYPNGAQNYPLIMTVAQGKLVLHYSPPNGSGWTTIWSKPVAANDWHRFALGIHTSDSASGGWAELYVDGAKQTFSNGSTRFTGRTWDGYNDPKWGAYDRGNTTTEIVNRVRELRIGTSYGDVG